MPGIPKRLTLRSQILALTLAVGLPAAAGVAWALSVVLASEKEAAIARVRSTSVQVASNLALLLRECGALLARLAGPAALQAAGTDSCAALAVEWTRLPADRATLALHAPDGRRLCGNGPSLLALPPAPGSDWFSWGLRTVGPVVGPVLPVMTGGAWAAPLIHPVRDATDQMIGLLVMTLDLGALQQRVMPPLAVGRAGDGDRWQRPFADALGRCRPMAGPAAAARPGRPRPRPARRGADR